MAFRSAVRRWPVASSQVRALMRTRQGQQQLQSRAYADYTGDSLNEKEKAAENRYIKQLEAERKLKKAAAGETHVPGGEVPIPSTTAEAAKSQGGFPTTAVIAGLAVAVGAYWLLSGSSKKEEKEKA